MHFYIVVAAAVVFKFLYILSISILLLRLLECLNFSCIVFVGASSRCSFSVGRHSWNSWYGIFSILKVFNKHLSLHYTG